MLAYKLFRLRKSGTLGSLFINRRQVIPMNVWLVAEPHLTKGYSFRPGWHCTVAPNAPHLSMKDRVWCVVEVKGITRFERPESQGGTWILAKKLRVLELWDGYEAHPQ